MPFGDTYDHLKDADCGRDRIDDGRSFGATFHPSLPGKETTTKPWTAPVGHRQPHASDVPSASSGSLDFLDQEDANVDRKISGVCRGC